MDKARRIARLVLALLAVAYLATSCDNSLGTNLAGKQCTDRGGCVAGYFCEWSTNTCLPIAQMPTDSGSGSSSDARPDAALRPDTSVSPDSGGLPDVSV